MVRMVSNPSIFTSQITNYFISHPKNSSVIPYAFIQVFHNKDSF
jgi:hypothetical protein